MGKLPRVLLLLLAVSVLLFLETSTVVLIHPPLKLRLALLVFLIVGATLVVRFLIFELS